MHQKEKRSEQHWQIQDYGEWLASELEKEGVKLSVTSENGLRVQGEITPAQKEYIRIWKRHLIEALSPKCKSCASPMQLINNGSIWFCPLGCESRKAD